MTTGGFINGPCRSKVKLHPLIWEPARLTSATQSDLELSKLALPSSSLVASSNSFLIAAKAGNYIVPRILARSKVRGFIASNCW